jgi:isoquinoline 1-oxidoreductase beta subunit
MLSHARTGRHATFGDMALRADALPPPVDVKIEDPKEFTMIGRRLPR